MVSLYEYQREYLQSAPRDFIMAAGTGLGKSRMSLAHYHRHNPGGRLLIVAPASKVRTGDWDREVSAALGDGFNDYQVMSYERFTKTFRDFIDDRLTVILDEAHYIANATSKRSRAAQHVTRVARQWIMLTATPLPNGWRSAGAYAIITGLVRNKTEFERRFVVYDRSRTTFPIFMGYREDDVLKKWWQVIARPLERTAALRLPSQSIGVDVELTKSQLATYTSVQKTRVYHDELLDSAPKLCAALRQSLTKYRMDAVRNILDGTDEHVVIFYNYNSEREVLLELLDDYDVDIYEQSGHASRLPEREKWDTMRRSVTIGQYQSASTAIELTYASITVFFSPTYSYSTFHQAMGRNKRNGQEKTVLFYSIRVRGTIDEAVYRALKAKKSFDEKLYQENPESY